MLSVRQSAIFLKHVLCVYLMETVTTQCFKIVGSKSYTAVKVHKSIFLNGLRLLHDRKYIEYFRQSAEKNKYEYNRNSVFHSVCLSALTYPFHISETTGSCYYFFFQKKLGLTMALLKQCLNFHWLGACFGFYSSWTEHFSLYRDISHREEERKEIW